MLRRGETNLQPVDTRELVDDVLELAHSELLTRRDQIERASNCPHGRPTTIRLTLRDLEKHFKRS